MKIQAEVSLYPLKTEALEDSVRRFIEELMQSGISVSPGGMSTRIAGESEELFRVISRCFAEACDREEVILVATFSNACPPLADVDRERE